MFSFSEVDQIIRKLAKSTYWQSIYYQCKELGCVQLFENTSEFTSYQLSFLGNLSFYSSIHMDIGMGKVSDLVLEDELYEDCYWYYKSQEHKSKTKRAGITDGEHGTTVKRIQEDKEVITTKNLWSFTKSRK